MAIREQPNVPNKSNSEHTGIRGNPMSLQYRPDARVIGKHSVASVGTAKRKPGHKLGNRLRKDIIGEGPRRNDTAFAPIDTGLTDAQQAATYNATKSAY